MFRGGFAWLNAMQNMSGERQWKRKEIESISEHWSEMSRRSPGKSESLDSLTTLEIRLTRSYRNLSAIIKWEISPVYWNRSFVQWVVFMQSRETQIIMVKWTNAGGRTKRAKERSFVYRPPAWQRWRNVIWCNFNDRCSPQKGAGFWGRLEHSERLYTATVWNG